MVARIDNLDTKPALTDAMGMTGILGSEIASTSIANAIALFNLTNAIALYFL